MPPAPKLHILIVEDHLDTLNMYRRLLLHEGHSVVAVADLGAALEAAEDQRFDLLISDVTLPDGSGWTLLERLREIMPGLPGIAVSGHDHPSDIADSERAGYCIHLSKPVHPVELYDAIVACAAVAQSTEC